MRKLRGKKNNLPFTHLQNLLYPDHGHGESGVYPRNTGHEASTHLKWDASLLQGTMRAHPFTPRGNLA